MKEHILMVGCGNMGGALLEGFLRGGHDVSIIETRAETLKPYQNRGIAGYQSVESFRKTSTSITMVIYAVKPQIAQEVIPAYKFLSNDVVHLSIMAGISLESIAHELENPNAIIVRTMPNLPIKVGEGAIVSTGNQHLDNSTMVRIDDIFCHSGLHLWLDDEELLHAVTAISGSGPGYVFHYMETLAKAGVSLGLSQDLALQLVVKTLAGSAIMAAQESASGVSLESQRESVTSKGGTTEAALTLLQEDKNGLYSLLKKATEAAKERSIALGGEKK